MKTYRKSISIYNGNNQRYTLGIPTLSISKFGNKTAKKHFERNTGLKLVENWNRYIVKPKTFKQLYKVFATYNFTTTFYNNASDKNTLRLDFKLKN